MGRSVAADGRSRPGVQAAEEVMAPACQTATFGSVGLVPRVCGGDRLPPSQLARGVIGNTPGFDPGIPGSSPGGPVPPPEAPETTMS